MTIRKDRDRTLEGSSFNSFCLPAIRELMVLMIASPTLAPAVLSSMMGNNTDCVITPSPEFELRYTQFSHQHNIKQRRASHPTSMHRTKS
jgi:hypothetical protein